MTNGANIFEQAMVPVVEVNRLTVANLETLEAFQRGALQGYVDLGLQRLKAAAEVTDGQSWQAFLNAQVEAGTVLQRMLVNDNHVLAALLSGFASAFNNLVKDSIAESTAKVTQRAT